MSLVFWFALTILNLINGTLNVIYHQDTWWVFVSVVAASFCAVNVDFERSRRRRLKEASKEASKD